MSKILRKLTGLLDSDDVELRVAAIRVIQEIGFSSKPVVQALGRCLREQHDDVRLVALRGLARLGAKEVVQWVVPLILSSGPLRDQAMAVIASVGPSVIPQLKQLYPQADFHGKRAVVTAISRIGGKPQRRMTSGLIHSGRSGSFCSACAIARRSEPKARPSVRG